MVNSSNFEVVGVNQIKTKEGLCNTQVTFKNNSNYSTEYLNDIFAHTNDQNMDIVSDICEQALFTIAAQYIKQNHKDLYDFWDEDPDPEVDIIEGLCGMDFIFI